MSAVRALLSLAIVAVALTGCIRQAAEPIQIEESMPPATPAPTPEPVTVEWQGRITASELGLLAHSRDTEPLVADVQREGFVFEITEAPQDFYTELTWTGPGSLLIMMSTPHVDGRGLEYFTEMSADQPLCLRIPADEIVVGQWQIMAHSQDALDTDFTFRVTTVGGSAAIVPGPHSSAEAAETSEAEGLPCDAPAANA